jgi:hypothetical protein
MTSYYETLFAEGVYRGLSELLAADLVATAFLEGKPERRGKHKTTSTERHAAFWSASFIQALPKEAWRQESLTLALARYLGQDRFACPFIVQHVATVAPDTLQRAARHAGLVLRQNSPRFSEIERLRDSHSATFADFVQILGIFGEAHELRIADVDRIRRHLSDLTPLELLAYTSLYAFEHLIPGEPKKGEGPDIQDVWDAIESILEWKLATCDTHDLHLSDQAIGKSLGIHLAPFLFPSTTGPLPRHDLYAAFSALIDAQCELNSFISRSADAFSYDESIRFVRQNERLEIVEVDPKARENWQRDGEKLARLHQYWLYRGMEALMASPETLALVSPAHLEANLQAFAKALGTKLQLQEVYGLADRIKTDTSLELDTFRALLSIELMTAFFIVDFLQPFNEYLHQLKHPWLALGRLAFGGMLQTDMQNRLPITWSDRASKIANITPWTVCANSPRGDAQSAEAILDFWTSDWISLAEQLRQDNPGIRPRLLERPMLKMGRHLFQLPWMMAVQNNATASINNLRRLGARRAEAREETRRIEQNLGELFRQRGFRVLTGHELPSASHESPNVGDIDLICATDNQLLVLELKSTYMRRSVKEAWAHRHTTLRKAGLQLYRKVAAIRAALESDDALQQVLGLQSVDGLTITAWIVDTSIEWDHLHFQGFLKVTLEEVLIALRDDSHWLHDPDGLFQGGKLDLEGFEEPTPTSLYPDGFSGGRFIKIVESAAVWASLNERATVLPT